MGLLVEDLMERDIATIPVSETMREAARQLLQGGIGSIIVHSDDDVPVGIITDTDVLEAVVDFEGPLAEVPVERYMSRPLKMIEASNTVRNAVARMNEEGVEQLVIVEEYEVQGIISHSDITASFEELIHIAHRSEQPPPEY